MGPRNGLRIQECRLRVCRFISKPASRTDGEAWIPQFAPTSTAGLVSVAQDSKSETQMFCYCSFVTFTKYFVHIRDGNPVGEAPRSKGLQGQTCNVLPCVSCDSPPRCRSSFVRRSRCLIFDTLQTRLIADDITGCRHQIPGARRGG